MEYSIPRLSDNYLFEYLIENVFLKKSVDFQSELSNATITIAGKSISINPTSNIEDHESYELFNKIKNSNGFSISKIIIGYGQHNQNNNIQYIRSSTGLVDKIVTNTAVDKNIIAFVEIHKELDKFICYGNNNNENKNIILSRLEGLSSTLIEDVHKTYLLNIKENENYRLEKEKEYNEKTEEELKKLESIYREKNEKLKHREEKVIDADNTTARRQVRKDLINSITPKAERFKFSKSITNNIMIIGLICFLLALFGFFVSWTSYLEIISNKSESATLWFHYIKSFSGGAIFLTSLTYFIRWLNSWTNRVANTELEYQKFERDLNRSHLAIEMCLEWEEKKAGTVPEKLLQAMTNELFITKDENHKYDEAHPVDQIASALIRSADKLEIPIGTAVATTSGKNLSKQKTTS